MANAGSVITNETKVASVEQPESGQLRQRSVYRHGLKYGNVGLLVDTETFVSEIVEHPVYCGLPNTPVWLMGTANVRNNVVPLFDIGWFLRRGATEPPLKRCLMIGQKDQAIAIALETLPIKLTITANDVVDAPAPDLGELNGFIDAVYRKNKQLWVDWRIWEFFESITARFR